MVLRGERVSTRVQAPSKVSGPIPAGRRLGSVALVYRGRVVRRVALVTATSVPAASLPRKVIATLGAPLAALALVALVALGLAGLRARTLRGREERLEKR